MRGKSLILTVGILFAFSMVLLSAGCGGDSSATLDTSTEQALKESLQKIEASLKPEELESFKAFLSTKQFLGTWKDLYAMHGLTYKEMVEQAKEMEELRQVVAYGALAWVAFQTAPEESGDPPQSIADMEKYGFRLPEGYTMDMENVKEVGPSIGSREDVEYWGYKITVTSPDGKLRGFCGVGNDGITIEKIGK